MSDATEDFDVLKKRVMAELVAQRSGSGALSFSEAMSLREYAKARTDLQSENLTMEQVAWKAVYEGLTEKARAASPDSMEQVESLERQRDNLLELGEAMEARLWERREQRRAIEARLRDQLRGIRGLWDSLIVGLRRILGQ